MRDAPFLVYLVIHAIMLIAMLVLAIITYRAKRTIGFLLLMLASVCYFTEWFLPYPVGALSKVVSSNAWAAIVAWTRSWWFTVGHTFELLFVGLIIAAFVCFTRESVRLSHDRPNQTKQPTASPRTASLSDD